MKKLLISCFVLFVASCTSKKQINYLNDAYQYTNSEISSSEYTLQPHDILKIDVTSANIEAAIPYNKPGTFGNKVANANLQSLQLDGYLISKEYKFTFPILGDISVINKTIGSLENELRQMLVEGQHLSDPIVNIRLLNAKFTI